MPSYYMCKFLVYSHRLTLPVEQLLVSGFCDRGNITKLKVVCGLSQQCQVILSVTVSMKRKCNIRVL